MSDRALATPGAEEGGRFLVVVAFLIEHDGHVLLLKRSQDKNHALGEWDFGSGHRHGCCGRIRSSGKVKKRAERWRLAERPDDARLDLCTAVREHNRPKDRRTVPRDEHPEAAIE